MNPLYRLIRQSKRVTWLMHRHGEELLGRRDAEAFRRNTPESFEIDSDSLAWARANPEEWVVKRAFGRMGDAVFMGCLTSADDWAKTLTEAGAEAPIHTLQRKFPLQTLSLAGEDYFPTLGVYLVNGEFAGYYSRVAPTPMIDHAAFHVATVVRPS